MAKNWQSLIFRKNSHFPIFGQKGPKMAQKQGFSHFLEKFVISFYCKYARMKDNIVTKFLVKTPYPAKFLFFNYGPKCSQPIRLQDFLYFNISKSIWRMKFIFCMQLDPHRNYILAILFFVGVEVLLANQIAGFFKF